LIPALISTKFDTVTIKQIKFAETKVQSVSWDACDRTRMRPHTHQRCYACESLHP